MIPPAPSENAVIAALPRANSPRPSRRLGEELRRIRELFDQAPGCMVVFVGPDHLVEMANPAYLSFTGLGRDIVGKPARLGLRRGFARGFGQLLDKVYASGEPRVLRGARVLVTRYSGGPDEEAFADFVLQPLRDSAGAIYGVCCQGHEVTVEKLAADELRASREQLRTALESAQAIFDNSHDVICLIDPDGRFRQVNKHAERLWGYRPEEMVGRRFSEFVHPDDLAMTAEVGRRVGAGLPTGTFINRYLHKDGAEVPVMWSAVRAEGGDSIISIGRDMREHMASEEKLRQAQKMEAIGRLTGGIAHDFNNLLTVVIGSTESLADALGDRPQLRAVARLALDAAERGAELVSRLLAFARTQPLAPQAIDCDRFLRDLLPILQRTLTSAIQIDIEPAGGGLHCLADRTQLTAAMLNLCINARDAMPAGGRLTIGAARDDGAGAGDRAEAFAVLSVRDTGEGMSQQIFGRAREPFFTTKPEGEGSGLGLSMVDGFASQSGGLLEIDSEPGRGTQVRIFLPQAARPRARARIEAPPETPPQPRHVLLVEDDDLLRDQVRRQLISLGCRVTAERNGRDALRRLKACQDVDLLMTDIVMPGGMNGRQLADRVRRCVPGLPILFTSGNTDEAAIRTLTCDGMAGFLGKPYRRAELAQKLAQTLGRQPVAANGG